jgi:hypothetical protein
MKNLIEVANEGIRKAQARHDASVAQAEHLFRRTQQALRLFQNASGPLQEALAKFGLEVVDVTFSKTGTMSDSGTWCDLQDSLNFSLRLAPTSGKFKFLTFQGYTARGDGKNDARLREKAAKIKEAISTATGFSADVNSCSLEVRGEHTSKTVLANVWVRSPRA